MSISSKFTTSSPVILYPNNRNCGVFTSVISRSNLRLKSFDIFEMLLPLELVLTFSHPSNNYVGISIFSGILVAKHQVDFGTAPLGGGLIGTAFATVIYFMFPRDTHARPVELQANNKPHHTVVARVGLALTGHYFMTFWHLGGSLTFKLCFVFR